MCHNMQTAAPIFGVRDFPFFVERRDVLPSHETLSQEMDDAVFLLVVSCHSHFAQVRMEPSSASEFSHQLAASAALPEVHALRQLEAQFPVLHDVASAAYCGLAAAQHFSSEQESAVVRLKWLANVIGHFKLSPPDDDWWSQPNARVHGFSEANFKVIQDAYASHKVAIEAAAQQQSMLAASSVAQSPGQPRGTEGSTSPFLSSGY